jgi:protease I
MRRLATLALVLAFFAVPPCYGQRRTRIPQRKIVQLTEPNVTGAMSLEETLAKRRSVRRFTNQALKWSQIGQLAWAGQGITDKARGLRTAPSAGSVYPIELFFATPEGLYVYRPAEHSLEQLTDQDVRLALAGGDATANSIAEAGCDIIVAGSVKKVAERFKDNARNYMLMEAGHIAQNIQLQAVSLGLGAVTVGGFNEQNVRKVCGLAKLLDPVYVICVGYPAGEGGTQAAAGQFSAAGKKIALIIASQNFHDGELFATKRVLDAAQAQTFIASTRRGVIRGALGGVAEASVLLSGLTVTDYDAIIFIGGLGAAEFLGNPTALNIARETVRTGKVLGAIGTAPSILADANVLAGIRATSLLSEQARLVQAGAIYTGQPVERERLIITAVGPDAAAGFGKAIADALAGL